MFRVSMILSGIQNRLIGNAVKDMDLLEKEALKYQNDENAKEILEGISVLMFDILPESDQNNLVSEAYYEAVELANQGKYLEGIECLDLLLRKIEKYKKEKEYDIDNDEQAVIIYAMNNEAVSHAKYPFSKIYSLKGHLLAQLKQYDQAIETMELAIEANPGNIQYRLDRISMIRLTNNLDKFFQENLSLFPYLCNGKYVANTYCNIGFYLAEKKDYTNAICALSLSLEYQESEEAYQELGYIQSILQKEIDYPTSEMIQDMAQKYHIPLQLNEKLLSVLYTFGMNYLQHGKKEAGKALITTLYSATKDPELLELMN